ncbi:hypothetical protein FOMPIDRAFT_1049420 [Fomitopsis schrenkii]|uniref:Uncharacterized protein n=1 Tax=Fomitopsis schrenkii TaxID=2126942 RepID=S8FQT3_FOMSC|nr:hypothetical protein FOMPIDRAFT_1049420 [Fomitopsis schrenkii]
MSMSNHCQGDPVGEREGTVNSESLNCVGGDNDCVVYNDAPPLLSCAEADRGSGDTTEVNATGNRAECPDQPTAGASNDCGSANDGVVLSPRNKEEIEIACYEYEGAAVDDDSDEDTILGDTEHNNGTNIGDQDNVASNGTLERLHSAPRHSPEPFPMPTPRLRVLGWLADREYFIELGRQLNLCEGPAADDIVELEAAAIHHVIVKTWWPNLMQCVVGGSDELVFAVYVDCKRRPYPPQAIPRSKLLPRKYCDRLEAWMPLSDEAPQWFTCEDGSYTPWRYAYQEPGPNAVWIDISRYQPHPGADYDRIEEDAEAEDAEEYYEEELGSELMDVGEDVVYDDVKDALQVVEDDDSVTVRGDIENIDGMCIADSEHDGASDTVDDKVLPQTSPDP